jgi:hypothetical protein
MAILATLPRLPSGGFSHRTFRDVGDCIVAVSPISSASSNPVRSAARVPLSVTVIGAEPAPINLTVFGSGPFCNVNVWDGHEAAFLLGCKLLVWRRMYCFMYCRMYGLIIRFTTNRGVVRFVGSYASWWGPDLRICRIFSHTAPAPHTNVHNVCCHFGSVGSVATSNPVSVTVSKPRSSHIAARIGADTIHLGARWMSGDVPSRLSMPNIITKSASTITIVAIIQALLVGYMLSRNSTRNLSFVGPTLCVK